MRVTTMFGAKTEALMNFKDSLVGASISPRDGEDVLTVASSIRTGRCWFRKKKLIWYKLTHLGDKHFWLT